jgi:Fe-S cluster assembly protein SufD
MTRTGRNIDVATAVQNIETYLERFAEIQKRVTGLDPAWLKKVREDAFALFCETGFPTTHDEDWRFTNVAAIARTEFALASAGRSQLSGSALRSWPKGEVAAELVFIDGKFIRDRSVFNLPKGDVFVSSLKEAIADRPADLEPHFGRYLDVRRDPFSALNTAFAENGAYVRLGCRVVLEAPIHLLFVSTANDAPTMIHPRSLLVFENESQATVVEEYVSVGGGTILSNSATELVAGENSTVSHFMIEREHRQAFNISTLRIQQHRSANVASHSLLLGGGLVRNNVHPVLAGEGGECLINGLFIGDGRQHLDNYMHVEHASPHCSSRQFYNGILDGHAHGVFHGRIVVHKNAQKTDAKQTNRNLLLSDNAQIDTKPQLEIYADDVKCTHGATIGQIEENALFYLRSRGLDEISARRILLLAFAGQCLERMKPGAARTYVERIVNEHLLLVGKSLPSFDEADREKIAAERNWEEIG